jgi:hypothetical protein
MRNLLSPRRARGSWTCARRMEAVAEQHAGLHGAATAARTVVSPVQGHRRRQRLRRSH